MNMQHSPHPSFRGRNIVFLSALFVVLTGMAFLMLPSSASAQSAGPRVPAPASGIPKPLPANHLIDVLNRKKLNVNPADASAFAGTVKIGGATEAAVAALEVAGSIKGKDFVVDGQIFADTDSTSINIGDLASGDGERDLALYAGNVKRITISQADGSITADSRVHLTGTGVNNNMWSIQPAAFQNDTFGIVRYESGEAVPSKSFVISNAGNVGIGTTSLERKLDISFHENNSTQNDPRNIDGIRVVNTNNTIGTYSALTFGSNGTASGIGSRRVSDDAQDIFFFSEGGAFEKMTIKASGNVGIGTTNPGLKLSVVDGWLGSEGNWNTIGGFRLGRWPGYSSGDYWVYLSRANNTAYADLAIGQLYQSGGLAYFGGKVGIGTTDPKQKLDVRAGVAWDTTNVYTKFANSVANERGLLFGQLFTGGETYPYIQGTKDGGYHSLLLNPSGGNVGIGTTNPARAKLQVSGMVGNTVASFGDQGISLVSNWPQVHFNSYWAPGGLTSMSSGYGAAITVAPDNGSMHFRMSAKADGADQRIAEEWRMTLTNDGRLGIGTTSPQAQLSVTPTGESWNEGIEINPAPNNYNGIYFRETAGATAGTWFAGRLANADSIPNGFAIAKNGLTGMVGTRGTDTPFTIKRDGTSLFGGNVGIGTDNPGSYKIYGVANTGGWAYRFDNQANESNVHIAHGAGYGLHVNGGKNASASTYLLELYSENKSGNNTKFYVRGDGNVGIGTTSPNGQLHLGDIFEAGRKNLIIGDDSYLTDIDIEHTLGIYSNTNGTIGSIKLGSTGGTISGKDGNVGIGIQPNSVGYLQLPGVSNNRFASLGINEGRLLIGSDKETGHGAIFAQGGGALLAVGAQGAIQFMTGSYAPANERMRIDSAGNVGIGTQGPNAKLEIVSQSQDALRITGNEAARTWRFGFGSDGNLLTETLWDRWKIYLDANNDSPDSFEIYHNGTAGGSPTQVFGTYDGNVGIGTTGPTAGLEIKKRDTWGSLAIWNADNSVTHFNYPDGKNYIRGTTIIADNTGSVGIGNSTPQALFDVSRWKPIEGHVISAAVVEQQYIIDVDIPHLQFQDIRVGDELRVDDDEYVILSTRHASFLNTISVPQRLYIDRNYTSRTGEAARISISDTRYPQMLARIGKLSVLYDGKIGIGAFNKNDMISSDLQIGRSIGLNTNFARTSKRLSLASPGFPGTWDFSTSENEPEVQRAYLNIGYNESPLLIMRDDGDIVIKKDLSVRGRFSAGGVTRHDIVRVLDGNQTWMNIGSVTPDSRGTFAHIRISGTDIASSNERGARTFIQEFEVYAHRYGGSTKDWVELPPLNGSASLVGARNFAVDAKFAGYPEPLQLRLRRLTPVRLIDNTNLSHTVSIVIETNTSFTADNSSGRQYSLTGGGYLGRQNGWMFPATTDSFSVTNKGLFVFGDGRVGIGTLSPCAKCGLDVRSGDVNVGFFSNNHFVERSSKQKIAFETDRVGLDVAELFESEEIVEIGDIVVISDNDRKLKKSSSPYQNSIVGIVSGAPALLFEGSNLKLGVNPDRFTSGTKPPVALVGRVPVKASRENGSIKPGDYLTSSSKPGVAMKATEHGMTIGIALERLEKDEDTILVFVNIGEKNMSNVIKNFQLKENELELKNEEQERQMLILQKRLEKLERKFRW